MSVLPYLPTFESAVGGDDPPLRIAVGVIARDNLFSHTFVLFPRPKKKMCVYCHMLKKLGSVGRKYFFFKFIFYI